ncbi:MAG: hypothetical protein GY679_01025 [Mycoplasma sp.]|nr:hypothetical protein [Mycoplasma sp.]
MENRLKKMNIIKRTFIIIGLLFANIGLLIVGIFSANIANQKEKRYIPVIPSINYSSYQNDITPYSALPSLGEGETPKVLLTLPALNLKDAGDIALKQVISIFNSLSKQKWGDAKTINKYKKDLEILSMAHTLPPGILNDLKAKTAVVLKELNDPETVKSTTQILNQFKKVSITKPLHIIKPQHIYEYFSTDATSLSGSEIKQSKDFSYKISEIDFNSIPKDKNVIFKIQDKSVASSKHKYSLVLNNKFGGIKKKLEAGKSADSVIKSLLNSRDIFVRDESLSLKYNLDSPTKPTTIPYIKLKPIMNKSTSKFEKIGIYINPSIQNKDSNSSIEISVEKETAKIKKGISWGILDNTYSTLHIKSVSNSVTTSLPSSWHADPIEPNKKMLKDAISPSSYYITSDWKIENKPFVYRGIDFKETNHLRFFMARGSGKISLSLKFDKKGSDAFHNSNNKIDINFDENGIVTKPNPSLYVNPTDWESQGGKNIKPIGISISKLPSSTNTQWLQIDLFLQPGIMSINEDTLNPKKELPFSLVSTSQRIFFETPEGIKAVDGKVENQDIIHVEKSNQKDKFNKILIGKVFANWSNPVSAKANFKGGFFMKENPTWFHPKAKSPLIATKSGIPAFGINHDIWEWTKNKFNNLGTKDNLLIKLIKDSNEAHKSLIEQDPKNGSLAKTSAGKMKIKLATGDNILKQLELVSALYNKWINNFSKDSSSNTKRESYLISNVGNANTIAQKLIISKSGQIGKMANEIVAGALGRIFQGEGALNKEQGDWVKAIESWEAGNYASLTSEQKKLLKPLIDNYGKIAPWDSLYSKNKIKDLGKPKPGIGIVVNQAYKDALQYMMWVVAPYFIEAINQIFRNEQDAFNKTRGQVLGLYMSDVLSKVNKTKNISAISSNNIKTISNSKLPTYLQGVKLLEVEGSLIYKVNSVKLGLESLIKFIHDTKLQKRYLTSIETKTFETFYKTKLLTDEKVYKDKDRKREITEAVKIIDKIISKVINSKVNSGVYTFEDIINKIIAVQFKSPKEVSEALSQTISKTIDIFASPSKIFVYEYFGGIAYSSYIQNLIIGSNVKEIITKWRDDSIKAGRKFNNQAIDDIISNDAPFDPKNLTRIAVNIGNYNLNYFIKTLSQKGYVIKAAINLYNSDIENSITFELPPGNKLVKMISNTEKFSTFSFDIIGIIVALTGLFTLVVSFRKSIKSNIKKITIIFMRGTFLVMIIGGVMLLTLSSLALL